MKMTVEVDCTPEEARRFLGLPDVSALNDHMVEQVKSRIDANMSLLKPEDLLKNWLAFGQGAQDQFRKMMEMGLSTAAPRSE